jgi:hypothetical protein
VGYLFNCGLRAAEWSWLSLGYLRALATIRRDRPCHHAVHAWAITAEIIYRRGGDDEFFDTPRHALVTGSVIGFVGAVGWECIEILLDYLYPAASIDHSLSDTFFDVVLGVIGGAAGAWLADRYLDRLFNRARWNSRRPKMQ